MSTDNIPLNEIPPGKFASPYLANILHRVTKRLEFIERRDGQGCEVSVPLEDLVAIVSAAQRNTRAPDPVREELAVALTNLRGFCCHTKGCEFAGEEYIDREFNAILGIPNKPCTCGLRIVLDQGRAALAKAGK